jgi:hypothetical protein
MANSIGAYILLYTYSGSGSGIGTYDNGMAFQRLPASCYHCYGMVHRPGMPYHIYTVYSGVMQRALLG